MNPRIDVLLTPDDVRKELEADVAEGLSARPKELPPKWFYDERGSRLFEQITRLPEYYLTRAEHAILDEQAPFVARFTGADTLIELGSGTSEKTRMLLDAFDERRQLRRFVPFDVSEQVLRQAMRDLAAAYPRVEIHALVADFERHLGELPDQGRRLIVFLGSTIGNFMPKPRADFLAGLAAGMEPNDALLLGTDLVKDPERLIAAYDDGDGVTADFNRNVLRVVNRELRADFRPARFDHVARWDPEEEWIEMRLRSTVGQEVAVEALDLRVAFTPEEELRTEISAKFTRDRVEAELAAANLALARWWTDPAGDFALSLAIRE